MQSVAEVFTAIKERLDREPQRLKGLVGKFQFDLSGAGGGQYHVDVGDGKATVAAGLLSDPDVTISMSGEDFIELATGRLGGTQAFMTGRLRVRGDMSLALRLQSLIS